MPRPLRICLPDMVYHVLNRGNNQQAIFIDDGDYPCYLDVLKRYKVRFGFKLFSYCLMTNHVHLLIKTSSQGTVSDIVKVLTISHTRRYHYRYQTSGHVWQGRFKSPIVSDDEYLLTLMRYIEQNPVRAGMVKHPQEYRFSSYRENSVENISSLIDKEENPVFMALGSTHTDRLQRYKDFASNMIEEDKLSLIRKSLKGQSHFSSEKFLEQIQARLGLSQKKRRGRPRNN